MSSFCSPLLRDLHSPFTPIPYTTARETTSRDERLGAAKKKQRVRRTEGRTGLKTGAREIAGGNSAPRDLDVHAVRHGPVPFRP